MTSQPSADEPNTALLQYGYVTSPALDPPVSAVTGKTLSAATRATYAADWALFTDWCTGTGHTALPADAVALAEFTQECPSAPATHRRRLAALAHHHHLHGHCLPAVDRAAEPPTLMRASIHPAQAELAMQLLPSHGWIGGLFGRRDRALLAVAADTQIPYRQIARLTVGHIRLESGGDATITDAHCTDHLLPAGEDPVLCGPCALIRWRRLLDVAVAGRTRLDDFLAYAKQVTSNGHHPCRAPKPIDPRNIRDGTVPADQPVGPLRRTDSPAHVARDLPAGPAGRKRAGRPQDAPRRRTHHGPA